MINKYILFFLTCLLLAIITPAAAVEPPKNPNSAKGCAICHYRWIDTFFIEGKGSELVEYASEKVVATPEMCFSCHDGSVKDSRVKMINGNGHKTNMLPPAGIKIPEIFPLDKDGKMQCATCHTAHGVPSEPDSQETIFMRISNKDSAMCRECHSDKKGGIVAGNHPMGNAEQPIPKKLIDWGAVKGGKKNQIICETCHAAHGSTNERYLIRDDRDGSLCLDCHVDKNMFDRSGRRNSNHAFNVQPTTATIAPSLQNNGAKLGYSGAISCQTCHKIHNNKNNLAALLIRDNRKSDLCLACHPDKQRLERTKHNLALSAKSEKNLEGETVMESGMCSACHLPHKAARKPYEKRKNTDRATALCMSCHAAGMVAENKKLAGYLHPVDVRLPEIVRDIDGARYRTVVLKTEGLDLPLYNEFGVKDKTGKVTCSTCHDIHGGTFVKETPAAENGPSNTANTLLRKSSPEICRECHAHKFTIKNSRHDLNTVFPNGNEIIKQKVSQPDLCRYCHLIHSSEPEGFLWKKKIMTQSGEQVEDMCTTCHAKNGLAPEMADQKNSHPVNTPLTGKTDTKKLPLFNAAGKMTEKGIMTCFTCHDPHRWSPIKSKSGTYVSIEGRPASHFLRIEITPTSDLCISCHEDKADVLQSDHNLLTTAPDAKNALGWTPYESGVCGACHIVHNSSEKIDLWAMAPGTGSNVMERMCNSCHSQNGAAAAKVPVISSHPDTLFVSVRENGKRGLQPFPFFDTKTGKLSAVGNISCPSCHDVHHWGANSVQGRVKKNIEGNVETSFLRPHVPDRVCKQCHGLDGLFVFKYFHNAKERIKKSLAINETIPNNAVSTHSPKSSGMNKNNVALDFKFQNADVTLQTNPHYTGRYCKECHEKTPAPGGDLYLRFGGDYGRLCRCHTESSGVYIHPFNITPTVEKRKRMPPDFPLENGKVTCLTCHDIYRQCQKRLFERNSLRGAPYPRRESFCYNCHAAENYKPSDPHKQLNDNDEIVIETCLICHKEKPDEKHAMFKDVTFIGNIEMICRRCHHIAGNHSGNHDHMKDIPSADGLKRIKLVAAKFDTRLPLDENGKMTCITCHNPHSKGVIPETSPGAKGAGSRYRHRLPENLCKECHQM